MRPLRVDADELHRVAAQIDALADKLSVGRTSLPSGSSWLVTSGVVTEAHSEVVTARGVFAERMRATSKKLAVAAAVYGSGDSRSGGKLRDLAGPAA